MGAKMGFDDTEIKTENQKKTLWLYRASSTDISDTLSLGSLAAVMGLSGWGGFEFSDASIKNLNQNRIKNANDKIAILTKEQHSTKSAEAFVLSDKSFETSTEMGNVKVFTRVPFSNLIQEQKEVITKNSQPATYGVGTAGLVVGGAAIGFLIGGAIIIGKLKNSYQNMGEVIYKALHPEKTNFTHPSNINEPKIGQVMQDGTVYSGISMTTGTKMYAMPKDSGKMTWNNAIKFTQKLSDQYGYNGSKQATAEALDHPEKDDGGWRLPTNDELNQLFENKDDIGSFDSSDIWYLSSSSYNYNAARVQRFAGGGWQYYGDKDGSYSVRCVRTEPRPKP